MEATAGAARRIVALGLAARTARAVVVALRGPAGAPTVVDRRELDLAAPGLPVQVYHAASGLAPAAAEDLVRRAHLAGLQAARAGVEAAVAELRASGYRVAGAGLVLASGRVPPDLRDVLASHALLHAAEGELVRDALADAVERCGLHLTAAPRRELGEQAAAALGLDPSTLAARVAGLGRPLGPPWRQEHKQAALVAWLALARASRPRRGASAR
jgi:hypothetical protein